MNKCIIEIITRDTRELARLSTNCWPTVGQQQANCLRSSCTEMQLADSRFWQVVLHSYHILTTIFSGEIPYYYMQY